MMQAIGLLTGAGGESSGTPKSINLDGVNKSLTINDLFLGHVTSDRVDSFSWGISANLPSTATGPLIGAPGSGQLDCTASIDIVSGTIRAYVQHNATTLTRRRVSSGAFSSGVNFSVCATRGASAYPALYVDGVAPSGNNGSTSSTPNDSVSVSVGKNGGAHREGKFWAFWWTPVEMSSTQVAALDALIGSLDYDGAKLYLMAISSDSVFMPVLSTDDLTSSTGSVSDLFGNKTSTPVNTSPSDLVEIP